MLFKDFIKVFLVGQKVRVTFLDHEGIIDLKETAGMLADNELIADKEVITTYIQNNILVILLSS